MIFGISIKNAFEWGMCLSNFLKKNFFSLFFIERSWIFMNVHERSEERTEERSWTFLNVFERFWTFYERSFALNVLFCQER